MDSAQPPFEPRPRSTSRSWGRAIAVALAVLALVAVAGLAVTQLPQFAAADPMAEPSATASPAPPQPTTDSPTPDPTEVATPSPSTETGELPTGPADAVMSFTARCDAVPPVVIPATTVLEDGRVIWRAEDGRHVVRQLTDESLEDFREQVRSTGLFGASADYELERRPNTPDPPGHGLCLWAFDWADADAAGVHVNSVMWLGDEEEALYYQPAPERETLHALAEQLMAPAGWYDDDGWVQPEAVPFEPEEYMVLVEVTVPQLVTEGAPDFDDVSWPFDEAPGEVGVEYGIPPTRCAVASAEDVETLAAEMAGADSAGLGEPPFHGAGAGLPWASQNAVVSISFWPLLPDGRPGCETPDL
jgi:hypothetical protein